MTPILTIIIAIVGTNGFWALVQWYFSNKKKKDTTERLALKGLLHSELYSLMKEYIARGSITTDEYDNLQNLYVPYVNLGGNGTIKRMMEEINHLPLIK